MLGATAQQARNGWQWLARVHGLPVGVPARVPLPSCRAAHTLCCPSPPLLTRPPAVSIRPASGLLTHKMPGVQHSRLACCLIFSHLIPSPCPVRLPLPSLPGGTGLLVYNKASGPLRGSSSAVFVHVGYDGWWLKVRPSGQAGALLSHKACSDPAQIHGSSCCASACGFGHGRCCLATPACPPRMPCRTSA